MHDHFNIREPKRLSSIWHDTQAANFQMASEPLTGTLLRTLAASKAAGQLLELGSGTGLSTAWMLDGMTADSELTTVDNDNAVLAVLTRHLGDDTRLKIVCADGDEFLRSLRGRQFDLVFADTWSGKYRLLDEALALVKPTGFYVVDDMLPQANWPEGHAAKVDDLIRTLGQREDFFVTKLSWASGLIMATRKP